MRLVGYVLLPGLAAAANMASADPAAHRPVVQQAVDNYFRSLQTVRAMTYLRRMERKEFDGKGHLRERTCITYLSDYIDGVRWNYIVERDDKPIDDLQAAQARVRSDVAEWKSKSPSQRKKAIEDARKRGRNETEYLREFAEALDFTFLGVETREGRPARVYSFVPRPGYKPKAIEGRIYEGVRGKLWLDESEKQMARLEADVFKEVNVGGFLAKIERGTRFELDQLRIEPNLWATRRSIVHFDLKLLMLKQIHNEVISQYRDYRRYTGPVFTED